MAASKLATAQASSLALWPQASLQPQKPFEDQGLTWKPHQEKRFWDTSSWPYRYWYQASFGPCDSFYGNLTCRYPCFNVFGQWKSWPGLIAILLAMEIATGFDSQFFLAMEIATGFYSQIFLAMEIATGFLEIPSRNSSQKNSAMDSIKENQSRFQHSAYHPNATGFSKIPSQNLGLWRNPSRSTPRTSMSECDGFAREHGNCDGISRNPITKF